MSSYQPPNYGSNPRDEDPPPQYNANASGIKFPEQPTYQDIPWAVAFFVHLIVILVLGVYYFNANKDNVSSVPVEDISTNFVAIAATILVSGFIVSWLWLYVMRHFAKCLIWSTLLLGCAITGVMALFFIASGALGVGIIFLIFFALNALYVYCVRDRIPLAVAILETVVTVVNKYPAMVYLSFASVIVQGVWVVLWSWTAYYALVDIENSDQASNAQLVYFFLLVSFFWTAQVIANTVMVTVAGVVAEWYFRANQQGDNIQDPTLRSFKRASTTSFGSICFGSFLVAVIKALRYMIEQARKSDNQWVTCIVACILNCIEDILEFFNLYAYTYVAMYGSSYCDAAKQTWQMLINRGWDLIVNDDLIGGVLILGSFFGGCSVGLISYIVAVGVLNIEQWPIVVVFGVLAGFIMTMCCLVVVQGGVAAIYICFAEDPAALQQTKPEVHKKLYDAYLFRYGDILRGQRI